MAGADRLVRVGVDTERDADERTIHSRCSRQLGLVGGVEHDGRAACRCRLKQGGVLVVPVHDQVSAFETGRLGERELTGRGHVRADALLAEQPQEGDVRERLRPEEDAAVGDRGTECPGLGANRGLAEDDKGSPVLRGELVRCGATELKAASFDARRVREELKHAGGGQTAAA